MMFPIIPNNALFGFFFLSTKPIIKPAKFIPNDTIILIASQMVSFTVKPKASQKVAARNVKPINIPPLIRSLIVHIFLIIGFLLWVSSISVFSCSNEFWL